MIINLMDIENDSFRNFDFAEILSISKQYNLIENDVFVSVFGKVTRHYECYYVEGSLKASIDLKCGKCLSPVNFILDFPFMEKFSGKENLQEDIYYFDGKNLDLRSVIIENILINIPINVVCEDNCNGLCHVCGQNLNEGSCNCEKRVSDSRFDVLSSLFNE